MSFDIWYIYELWEVLVDVSKEDLIEQEIRKYHKQMMINYMVKVIEIHLKVNDKCDSIYAIYDSCRDTIVYSNKELNQIFDSVKLILKNKYNLKYGSDVENGNK